MLTTMQDVVLALRRRLIDWDHKRTAELVGEVHTWTDPTAGPVHARSVTVDDNGLYVEAERDGRLMCMRGETDPAVVVAVLTAWGVLPQVVERSNGRHAASEVTP